MNPEPVAAAAANNAAWCDAVCRTHGHPGEFSEALWLNRAEVHRFYPNVVTLSRDGADAQLGAISRLTRPGRWAVKDSFATLDLAPLGFTELFAAQWISFPSSASIPAATSEAQWIQVRDTTTLAAWEAAWSGHPRNLEHPLAQAVFRPALLDDAGVTILGARHHGTFVAGAIAYRAAGVVGLSNTFFIPTAPEALRAEALGQTLAAFPGMPIVGYERGAELAQWCALGFKPIGPLRVWLKAAG
jgi:hypothetical protein